MPLIQWVPRLPVIAYFTGICLLVGGLGLATRALRWPRVWTVIFGIILAALGWAWLLENKLGWRLGIAELEALFPAIPGIPPIHPSPAAAACFGFLGVAIAALGLRRHGTFKRLTIWVCGSLALAPYFMVIGSYVTGFMGIEDSTSPDGMAVNTLAGMLFLGAGLLAARLMEPPRLIDDALLPLPVLLIAAGATWLFWLALSAQKKSALHNEVQTIARPLAMGCMLRVNAPIRVIERMKGRWELRGGMSYEEWKQGADAHFDDIQIFAAIAWADPSGKIVWCRPDAAAAIQIGRDIRKDHRWDAATALDRALQARTMAVSPTVPLRQGGTGFLACFPLFKRGTFDGWLVGIIRIDTLLSFIGEKDVLPRETVSIFEDDRLIYGPQPSRSAGVVSEEISLDFHGRTWRFVITTRPLVKSEHFLPAIVLVLGMFLAVTLAAGMRAYQQIAWKNREIHGANKQLERYANEDYLTGLWNRRSFDDALETELRRAERVKRPLSVIMSDVDFFKKYNDTYGHQAGDECLRRVAAVFKNAVRRPTDIVGRYGGEEFCAVLAETDAAGARVFAENVRQAVQAMNLPHEANPPGCVTASFGVASVDFSTAPADDSITGKSLVAKADTALYAAKEAGRNTVR
jgi:diguanylate cyclase (GGDEF)-like protein